jgi:hypothetical protein
VHPTWYLCTQIKRLLLSCNCLFALLRLVNAIAGRKLSSNFPSEPADTRLHLFMFLNPCYKSLVHYAPRCQNAPHFIHLTYLSKFLNTCTRVVGQDCYSMLQHFWLVEKLVELVKWPAVHVEMAWGGVYLLGPIVWQGQLCRVYLWGTYGGRGKKLEQT